jgi:glycosyltransferase involved in cell wall biosynthesis
MYKRLHDRGVEIAFIAGRSSGARANGVILPPYENIDGFPIYRLYRDSTEMLIFPQRKLKEVVKIATALKPELILCNSADNMRLALMLRKNLNLKIPVALRLEIAGAIPKSKFVASWKMRPIRLLIGVPSKGPELWSWLCQRADAIITSNPPDQQILHLLSKHGKPVYYLPWPASIENYKPSQVRDRQRGIYAGLLVPFKNTKQFEWMLPAILQNTSTKEFIVIGAGTQAQMMEKLRQQIGGNKIKYIPRLIRSEVLNFISGSYFGLTPVKEGGWGFIGDCWGTGTPLIMLHNVFCSKDLEPCVARDREDLIRKINRLYEDPEFYERVQKIGYKEFKKRTADAVGDELYTLLSKTLEKHRLSSHSAK